MTNSNQAIKAAPSELMQAVIGRFLANHVSSASDDELDQFIEAAKAMFQAATEEKNRRMFKRIAAGDKV